MRTCLNEVHVQGLDAQLYARLACDPRFMFVPFPGVVDGKCICYKGASKRHERRDHHRIVHLVGHSSDPAIWRLRD